MPVAKQKKWTYENYTKRFMNCQLVETRLIASLRGTGFIIGQFKISLIYYNLDDEKPYEVI